MKKNVLLFFMSFFVIILFAFNGCDALNSEDNGGEPDTPNVTNAGVVLGQVKGVSYYGYESNLGDVSISIGNQTAVTNNDGRFTFTEVSGGTRVIVKFSKDGYVATSKIVNVVVGQTTFIDVSMLEVGQTTTVASTGGTVTTNSGATVTFGANAFSNGGSATVEATYFDPTASYFANAFPGDFRGSQNGVEGTLESFGYIDVNLTNSSGTAINLASGQTAEIRIPIPYALQATAPNTIPLWYYDETAGIWKAEGTGTRVGNEYVGVVSHFTSWNWDRLYDVCYVSGRVVDVDGNPVNHAFVTADGVDYSGRSYKYTGSDGTFRIGVKPNSSINIQASKGGVSSSVISRTTPGNGQELNVGDIVLSAPWASMTLTWNALPRDLDSHLLIPAQTSSGSQYHVYWMNKGDLTTYPNARLDYDYTGGYGPENISVSRKYQGTYSYYIYLFADFGSGTIQNSGANVSLMLQGNLYNFTAPTTGNTEYRYWHVFDLVVGSGGSVSLQQKNVMLESAPGSSSSLLKAEPDQKPY